MGMLLSSVSADNHHVLCAATNHLPCPQNGEAAAIRKVKVLCYTGVVSFFFSTFKWFFQGRNYSCGFSFWPTFGFAAMKYTWNFDFQMNYVGAGTWRYSLCRGSWAACRGSGPIGWEADWLHTCRGTGRSGSGLQTLGPNVVGQMVFVLPISTIAISDSASTADPSSLPLIGITAGVRNQGTCVGACGDNNWHD